MKIKETKTEEIQISKKIKNILCEKKFKYIALFWTIISIQFILGRNLEKRGHIYNGVKNLCIDICMCIFLSIIFIALHYCILKLFEIKKKDKKEEKNINSKHSFWIYFLIIFVCWIPTVLAFYPCIFGYDGPYQILNLLILNLIQHHPIVITLLYSGFFSFGLNINSPTIGMFLFALFQMALMAFIFAHTVKFISENTNKKWLRNISILFYALYPYNQLFSITTTKDVIFAGLMLVFIIQLYKMIDNKCKIPDYIFLVIIGILMLLSRNNSVYTLIVSLPLIVLILLKQKEKCIKIGVALLAIIIMYKGINNSLYKIFNNKPITDIKNEETIIKASNDEGNLRTSTFSQLVGRTVRDNEDELTQEEKEKISYYFKDYKELGNKYQKNIVDSASRMINPKNIRNNKKDFLDFCIKLGMKYPMSYVESILDTTRGYWYMADTSFSEIEMYDCPGAFELYDFKIAKENYRINYDSKLPKLKELYTKLFCKNEYQKIPVLYVLFQPCIFFYITFAFMLFAIYKKNKNNLVVAIVLFTFYCSCYLAHCSIIRYVYPVIVSTPLMLGLVIKNLKTKK